VLFFILGTEHIRCILEVGCGQGHLSRIIAKQLPNAKYYGLDVNPDYLKMANTHAQNEGIRNTSYAVHNAEKLPAEWEKNFDWIIMYDVLHDLPHPMESMDEVRRVMKDDAVAFIVDPQVHSHHKDNIGDVMTAGIGYSVSCFLCLPCSSADNSAAKNGIGWGEEKKQAFLEDNGWIVKDKRYLCNNKFEYMFTEILRHYNTTKQMEYA